MCRSIHENTRLAEIVDSVKGLEDAVMKETGIASKHAHVFESITGWIEYSMLLWAGWELACTQTYAHTVTCSQSYQMRQAKLVTFCLTGLNFVKLKPEGKVCILLT